MNILEHPQLKDLQPQNEREGLLYLKAYLEAIQATTKAKAVEMFGLEAVGLLHQKVMSELTKKVKGK